MTTVRTGLRLSRACTPAIRFTNSFRNLATLSSAQEMRVRRSLLYIPGSNEKMLVKSRSVPADTLVYDLEDRFVAKYSP